MTVPEEELKNTVRVGGFYRFARSGFGLWSSQPPPSEPPATPAAEEEISPEVWKNLHNPPTQPPESDHHQKKVQKAIFAEWASIRDTDGVVQASKANYKKAEEHCMDMKLQHRNCTKNAGAGLFFTQCADEERAADECTHIQMFYLTVVGYAADKSQTPQERERLADVADDMYLKAIARRLTKMAKTEVPSPEK